MPAMKLAVFGATGGTGSQIVERALAQGHEVTAFARDPSKVKAKVRVVQGDVTNEADVAKAIAGQDAALSSIGPRKGTPPGTLISDSTRAIVRALETSGGKRFVLESGFMVSELKGIGAVPRTMVKFFRRLNHALYEDKLVAETLLRESKVGWVIVRPPNLDDRAPRGAYRAGPDLDVHITKKMSHADVADAMLRALGEDAWTNQAIDLSY
jgi:putative NADH-flavin reductase